MKNFKLPSGIAVYSSGLLKPNLLVIGGGPGLSAKAYNDALPALFPNYNVISFDYRGNGNSLGFTDFGIEFDYHDLVEIKEAIDEPLTILAHSFGGPLAIRLALEFPQSIKRLILIGTAAGFGNVLAGLMDRKQNRLGATRFAELVSIFEDFVKGLTTLDRIEKFVELEVCNQLRKNPEHSNLKWLEANMDFNPVMFLANQDFVELDFNSRLGELKVPTDVIVGAEDIIVPVEFSQHLAATIPQSGLHLIPNAGHWCFIENSESFQGVFSRP